jgi:hypothetical protein
MRANSLAVHQKKQEPDQFHPFPHRLESLQQDPPSPLKAPSWVLRVAGIKGMSVKAFEQIRGDR